MAKDAALPSCDETVGRNACGSAESRAAPTRGLNCLRPRNKAEPQAFHPTRYTLSLALPLGGGNLRPHPVILMTRAKKTALLRVPFV